MYCHGSPRLPTREYVVPGDAGRGEKMNGIFDRIRRVCFIGHSHIPRVHRRDGWHASPEDLGGVLDLGEHPDQRILVNVGSVGLPRDGRPGASYVTFNGEVERFHRVSHG
jgi:predicted phosphodiesterase